MREQPRNPVAFFRQLRAAVSDEYDAVLQEAEQRGGLNDEDRLKLAELEENQKRVQAKVEEVEADLERRRRRAHLDGESDPQEGNFNGDAPSKPKVLLPNQKLEHTAYAELPPRVRPGQASLGRWLRGVYTGNWEGAEIEREIQAGLTTTPDTAGGYLVPSPLSARVIDLARNQARIFQAGAMTIPMTSRQLTLARLKTDPSGDWVQEDAAITPSDMTFGSVVLSAKTLACLVKISIELFEDAQNLTSVVESAMAATLAIELDRAALRGAGGDEPKGIRNYDGIQTIDVGTNGAAVSSYDWFSQAWEKIQTVNGPDSGLAAIYAPRTAGAIDRLKDAQDQPLQAPESFRNLRKLVTNQVPINLTKGTADNASEAYVGDFANLLVGMRTSLRLEVSREASDSSNSAFANKQVWIRCYLRADTALAREDHFVLIDGIIPA